MISVERALGLILAESGSLKPVGTPLHGCTGLCLSEPVPVTSDSPPFDKSMMDGFAVASSLFDRSPSSGSDVVLSLKVIETIAAGQVPRQVQRGPSASQIMTGAPIPGGADCVVPIECVEFEDSNPVEVRIPSQDVVPGKHVLKQASLAAVGEALLPEGTILEAQHVAALAEFGIAEVPCVPRPRIAVLATGSELVDLTKQPGPGQIRNSNEPMLLSQVTRSGCDGTGLGIASDHHESLKASISRGLKFDVLLLSGGVSAGTLDLVPSVLKELEVEQVFHKVSIKPGKPIWFGTLVRNGHRCLVFGLPGNPVSSMVCFEVFVRPALRSLAGHGNEMTWNQKARMQNRIQVKGDRQTFFPALLEHSGRELIATALPWKGSADLRTTAAANGLLILDPTVGSYEPGDPVNCIVW